MVLHASVSDSLDNLAGLLDRAGDSACGSDCGCTPCSSRNNQAGYLYYPPNAGLYRPYTQHAGDLLDDVVDFFVPDCGPCNPLCPSQFNLKVCFEKTAENVAHLIDDVVTSITDRLGVPGDILRAGWDRIKDWAISVWVAGKELCAPVLDTINGLVMMVYNFGRSAVVFTIDRIKSTYQLVENVVDGKNIFDSLVRYGRTTIDDYVNFTKNQAKFVQAILPFIPGVGSGISAAIGAGLALLEGGSPLEIAIRAAYGAIPIPPGVRNVTDSVLEAALSLIRGESITDALILAVRQQTPEGLPRDIFDTLVQVIIKGKPVLKAGGELVLRIGGEVAKDVLPAVKDATQATVQRLFGQAGDDAMTMYKNLVKQVGPAVSQGLDYAVTVITKAGLDRTVVRAVRQQLESYYPPQLRNTFAQARRDYTNTLAAFDGTINTFSYKLLTEPRRVNGELIASSIVPFEAGPGTKKIHISPQAMRAAVQRVEPESPSIFPLLLIGGGAAAALYLGSKKGFLK